MDKVRNYQEIIRELLSEIGSWEGTSLEVETQLLFDTERNHYQILNAGWHGLTRTYGVSIHIDIKDGKIWIQRNAIDLLIAEMLVEKGVPKSDIVLAFHPLYKRPYTGFAVA